ncbi:MAG: hypothetical protein ACO33A_14240, partial [Hyphomonas sp.]
PPPPPRLCLYGWVARETGRADAGAGLLTGPGDEDILRFDMMRVQDVCTEGLARPAGGRNWRAR